MSTHNLFFEQKYEKYLKKNFPFLVVKFSIYLNRHVSVMTYGYNVVGYKYCKLDQSKRYFLRLLTGKSNSLWTDWNQATILHDTLH